MQFPFLEKFKKSYKNLLTIKIPNTYRYYEYILIRDININTFYINTFYKLD